MNDPKKPIPGELHIDATEVQLTDITPDQIKKLTKVRDGYEEAVAQLLNLKPADVERAGINPAEIARLGTVFAEDQHISEFIPSADKLAELLHEGRLLRRHEIGTILGEIASQARRRSERVSNGPEVLGPVDLLMDYQYGPGAKGAATREKAKEAVAKTKTGTPGTGGTGVTG
jgi:hypothetical protein